MLGTDPALTPALCHPTLIFTPTRVERTKVFFQTKHSESHWVSISALKNFERSFSHAVLSHILLGQCPCSCWHRAFGSSSSPPTKGTIRRRRTGRASCPGGPRSRCGVRKHFAFRGFLVDPSESCSNDDCRGSRSKVEIFAQKEKGVARHRKHEGPRFHGIMRWQFGWFAAHRCFSPLSIRGLPHPANVLFSNALARRLAGRGVYVGRRLASG